MSLELEDGGYSARLLSLVAQDPYKGVRIYRWPELIQ